MKKALEIGTFLIIAIFFDFIFSTLNIPITFNDVLLIALGSLFGYLFGRQLFTTEKCFLTKQKTSVRKKIFTIIMVLLFLLMSFSLIIIGISEPLLKITGVKGPAHGYSIAYAGFCMLFVISSGIYIYWSEKRM